MYGLSLRTHDVCTVVQRSGREECCREAEFSKGGRLGCVCVYVVAGPVVVAVVLMRVCVCVGCWKQAGGVC